jgi:hypothetical protein
MSLCADLDGLQTHSDLSVAEALELLRERGEDAVYALENLRPEEPRPARNPAEPSPAAAPSGPAGRIGAAITAEPSPSPPAPTSAGDKALIDSFAAALSTSRRTTDMRPEPKVSPRPGSIYKVCGRFYVDSQAVQNLTARHEVVPTAGGWRVLDAQSSLEFVRVDRAPLPGQHGALYQLLAEGQAPGRPSRGSTSACSCRGPTSRRGPASPPRAAPVITPAPARRAARNTRESHDHEEEKEQKP